MHILHKLLLLIAILLLALNSSFAKASEKSKPPTCDQILSQASALFVQDSNGNTIYSKNINSQYIPASTIKVLTAFVSLKVLGENYRFHTKFYVDSDGNLKIKGFGDPFITSEVMKSMTSLLSHRISTINNIVFDDTFFAHGIEIPGSDGTLNPYDSPVGALCVNFNTASVIKKNGIYTSGEAHTPITPYVVEMAKRYNISSGRFLCARTQEETTNYFGALLFEFLSRAGVKIKGKILRGEVKSGDKLILDFESPHSLKFVIREMLKYSNNFIANQLFLVSGAMVLGAPATLQKGAVVTKDVARSQLGFQDFSVVEGSGLSRENRLTAYQFMKLLKAFYPYMDLLKERNHVLYKTGTLKGVSNRIGYLLVGEKVYPFVIIRNGNGPPSSSLIDCLQRQLEKKELKRARVM